MLRFGGSFLLVYAAHVAERHTFSVSHTLYSPLGTASRFAFAVAFTLNMPHNFNISSEAFNYQTTHINDNKGPVMLAMVSVLASLSTVAILLRASFDGAPGLILESTISWCWSLGYKSEFDVQCEMQERGYSDSRTGFGLGLCASSRVRVESLCHI